MARAPDYYKVLGVDKKASQDQIKTAYRKLARRYHPDTNKEPGAEERFKEISEAYDVLGDPEKRKKYDRGQSVFTGGNPFGGGGTAGAGADFGSFSDILSNIFNTTAGRGGARTRPAAERGRDLETTVSLSFEQAVAGAQIPVSVATHVPCNTCRGTGARPGTSPIVCPVCQGRGVESQGQGVFDDRRQIASFMGMPQEQVKVTLITNGGAFGGKEDMSVQAQTALLAHLTGKPLVGNGDVHRLAQLGSTYSLVEADPDPAAICAAIRSGHVQVRTQPLNRWKALTIFGDIVAAGFSPGRRSRQTTSPVLERLRH